MTYYRGLIKKTAISIAVIGIGAFVIPAARAGTQQLITNGGFETGDLTGWTETDQADGSGTWFVLSGTGTPESGETTVGPDSGTFYAVTDQTGPGSHVLEQNITVAPDSSSVIFSFDQFVNDWSGVGPLGDTLDYTVVPTQHATVSLLNAGADPFSTSPTDILETFYDGVDPQGSNPNPYTAYSFDITNLVQAGGDYTIRFSETDNQLFMNDGVDNVSVLDTSDTATPEPAPGLDLGVGLLGVCGLLLARSRKVHKSIL